MLTHIVLIIIGQNNNSPTLGTLAERRHMCGDRMLRLCDTTVLTVLYHITCWLCM